MRLSWTAEEVLLAIRGDCLHEQSWIASGVSVESERTQTGDLFIAVPEPNVTLNEQVNRAFAQGAVAAIVQQRPTQIPASAPLILVDDVELALQDLGKVGRGRSQARVICAIRPHQAEDSYNYLSQLHALFNVLGNCYTAEAASNANPALALARLPQRIEWSGISLPLHGAADIAAASRHLQPEICVIEPLKTQQALPTQLADKAASCFRSMRPTGTALLSRDDHHYISLLAAARTAGLRRILSYGRHPKADARLLALGLEAEGQRITAHILGQRLEYLLPTTSEACVISSLASLLSVAVAGYDPAICAEALIHYQPAVYVQDIHRVRQIS